MCSQLSYINDNCPGDADAGIEAGPPLGVSLCWHMEFNGRAGVFEALFPCLDAISDPSCSAAHDAAVQACVDSIYPQACPSGPIQLADGGTTTCADINTACPAVSVSECETAFDVLSDEGDQALIDCFNNVGLASCDEDFAFCTLPF